MIIKKRKQYATIDDNDGVNYREIAETMSELGYPMGHSSVRNYIIRIMNKFIDAIADEWQIKLNNNQRLQIAMTPSFQQGIADILQVVEFEKQQSNHHIDQR